MWGFGVLGFGSHGQTSPHLVNMKFTTRVALQHVVVEPDLLAHLRGQRDVREVILAPRRLGRRRNGRHTDTAAGRRKESDRCEAIRCSPQAFKLSMPDLSANLIRSQSSSRFPCATLAAHNSARRTFPFPTTFRRRDGDHLAGVTDVPAQQHGGLRAACCGPVFDIRPRNSRKRIAIWISALLSTSAPPGWRNVLCGPIYPKRRWRTSRLWSGLPRSGRGSGGSAAARALRSPGLPSDPIFAGPAGRRDAGPRLVRRQPLVLIVQGASSVPLLRPISNMRRRALASSAAIKFRRRDHRLLTLDKVGRVHAGIRARDRARNP